MASFVQIVRKFLWRVLGFDYNHMLKSIDYVFLNEDAKTTIGENSYNNHAIVYRWSDAPLSIGKYCSISYGVKFVVDDGSHPTNAVTSYPFKGFAIGERKGIKIGHDVWIGMNSVILNGVTIGNGVTIAAGSVVIDDIPDYCVAAGVPAKVVKHKCSPQEKAKLNEIAWWEWPSDKIERCRTDFLLSIREFIQKYG